jgi:ribose transport system ATP-binding protein
MSFPGVVVLHDVDFKLDKGEVVSLVGENGAGKSTLMSVIGGVYTPDSGEIFIKGEKVEIENPALARRYGIGYVHQEPTLAPNMTGTENLFLGQEQSYFRIMTDTKLMRQKSYQILEEIGITFDPDKRVGDMSMAEKEAVEIAKAMLQRPKILILDEVTAPLDQVGVQHLFRIIKKLKQSGIGIIYITHRLRETFEISDKIFVLRDGRKVGTLHPKETSKDEVINLMVGEEGVLNSNGVEGDRLIPGHELLRCENLSNRNSFKNISLSLRANEIVGLTGLKGSGRSRFVRALFGLIKVDKGEIYIKDRKVKIRTPLQAMNAGIGYIPGDRQNEGLASIRNVGENLSITTLCFFTHLFGVLKLDTIRQKALKMVKDLNIKPPSLRKPVANLSGGNQQKVMIGKWLERDLPVLIFDEPTRGVDVKSKAEIHRLLIQLKKQGKGIIVISSDLPELISVSDRILVMSQGAITTECSGSENTEEHILKCLHVDPTIH